MTRLFSGLDFDELMQDEVPEKETKPTAIDPKKNGFASDKKWVYNFDEKTKRHNILLFGVIAATNDYRDIISLLYKLTEKDEVLISIHSRGGAIRVAQDILTAMARCKATIITNNIGMAASCGSLILSYGDKIHVDPNTTTMFHHAAFGYQDSVHRMLSYSQHAIELGVDLLTKMKDRGILTEDEVYAISQRGEEFYLSSTMMEERLRANNLWYEGEL